MIVALIIPCYNEEAAIEAVIDSFKKKLPGIKCYVYDNNSTDLTVAKALKAGAIVRRVSQKGKGNVVRRMFADVDADIYVMVDGDGTYDASVVNECIGKLVNEKLDMVVGRRVSTSEQSYRFGHYYGNKLLTKSVQILFENSFDDMLSGYRVFSKRFVKSFPALSTGFEIETELTVHALALRMPMAEIDTDYGARQAGSSSKLSTYKDGLKIAITILRLFKNERPFIFFFGLSILSIGTGIFISWPIILTYIETGLVPRLPTAVLSSSLILVGMLLLVCGLILETVTIARLELKRLHYISIS
jgi:glycosyltransferase involved in cell wall biosynthesis